MKNITDIIRSDIENQARLLTEQIDVAIVNKNIDKAERDVAKADQLLKIAPKGLTPSQKSELSNLRRALTRWKKFLADTSNMVVLRSKYVFPATLDLVLDGDTIVVTIDQGFNDVKIGQKMRLYGIDAWEMTGEDAEKGLLAKRIVERLLPEGGNLLVETIAAKTGKFGRWLAIAWVPIPTEELEFELHLDDVPTMSVDSPEPTHFNLNEWMLAIKAAKRMVM